MSEEVETIEEIKQRTVADKFKQSTTFLIVVFSMINLVAHVVLMFVFGNEISYMGDLVPYTFYVLLTYVGGEKMVNTWGKK